MDLPYMRLFWHKWITRRGTSWYLRPEPQEGPRDIQPLDDRDVATVIGYMVARENRVVLLWEWRVQERWGRAPDPTEARALAETRVREIVVGRVEFIAPW